ncbi:DUF3043 domain-containing protein [Nesterenkonia haasae]|uniref:DUF3043 domain-containing protein n=1 Tax=Nesterenkonia haasae TaxID=2587813 RepID=UPI001391F729|nr:DUF3043 domain-containing protein [Nesterenkonia haasae]NDK30681.1 DUF3043 domain-containing protein [Nesterenkonia haasae]
MLGFRKKSQTDNAAQEAAAAREAEEAAAAQRKRTPERKGVPTPKRRDQEAARRRPLVHNDRKAARASQRKAIQEQRAKMRQAMETGEEKYLPARDRGPQKRWIRDYVDARHGVGEWLLVLVLVFLFASFLLTDETRALTSYLLFVLMLAVFTELFWVGHKTRKGLEAKFGVGNMEKGSRFYAAMRALQMRRLRLPKPMVNRGEFPS